MLKKLIILLIFLFISNSAYSVDITLWHSASGAEADSIEGLATIFNLEHKDIKIKAENVRKRGEGFYISEYILDAVKKNKGPDIFIWVNDKIGYWAKHNIIKSLDDLIPDKDYLNNYFPTTVEAVKSNGHIYGLPISFECLILFYNKNFIKTPPLTTDDLSRLAKKFTDKKKKQYGLCYQGSFYEQAMWFNGFNAELFDKNGRPIIDSENFVKSLTFSSKLEKLFPIPSDFNGHDISYDFQLKLFNEGKLAMLVSGPWTLKSINPEIPFGLSRLPFIKEANNWAEPFLGVKTVMLTTNTKHPKEAFEAASFYASAYAGYVMATYAGYQPAQKGAYAYDEINEDEYSIEFRKQAYHSKPFPNREEMEIVWRVMNDHRINPDDANTNRPGVISRAKAGKEPIKDILKEFQKISDAEYAQMRKKK